MHQHRAAYELFGTPYSDFTGSEDDARLRQADRGAGFAGCSRECERIVTNAQNTADRLQRFNGIAARPLYHPPPMADRLHSGEYGDYVLSSSRLEPLKRVELAIRAMAHVAAPVRLVDRRRGIAARARSNAKPHNRAPADRIDVRGRVLGRRGRRPVCSCALA